ncbi:PBS lyase heat domain-containing protein repeat-containing protein [Mycobacterium sp. MS1601]|uniref:HEAT repeat domain-containing protein n=1 Tax=Mycobacterium sp. MS1601 TaxID=1936029 RepID=UPI0009790DC7|nr:HEAT repeat domain-containing protein [Mycobacterium sp. MS1601]AQA04929.1 PBS lyase heat domain-containing protein repeat-containing protein [Mycobacterium sp. MS1601]
MQARTVWSAELRRMKPSERQSFLLEHSGLPGPRANTELALAFADVADRAEIDEMLGTGDEYLALCAAVALGRRAADKVVNVTLRELAADSRWRVREGVAMGLQLLGDTDPDELDRIVRQWARDPDPLVERAAAAAICEPRLLRATSRAATAIWVCRHTTAALARRSPESRRDPSVRALRQTLGYCWSVAVAANPEPGLAAFRALDDSDPDVAWIIAENLRKKRLTRLL